jgi:hypothetical protein
MADASAILSQSTNATNVPTIASAATALAANTRRTQWSIQNLGTNPLFVRLATGASSTVFHVVLKASAIQDDGTGGILSQDSGAIYCGEVSIAGTTPRYTVMEMSN